MKAWDSRNSFRNFRWVLLTWETLGRNRSAPAVDFVTRGCVCQAWPLGWELPCGRAGTQPKPAKSQRVFLELVSDGESKGVFLQALQVCKQNWKHNTSSERPEVLFQPLCPSSMTKTCVLICCVTGDKQDHTEFANFPRTSTKRVYQHLLFGSDCCSSD